MKTIDTHTTHFRWLAASPEGGGAEAAPEQMLVCCGRCAWCFRGGGGSTTHFGDFRGCVGTCLRGAELCRRELVIANQVKNSSEFGLQEAPTTHSQGREVGGGGAPPMCVHFGDQRGSTSARWDGGGLPLVRLLVEKQVKNSSEFACFWPSSDTPWECSHELQSADMHDIFVR